MRYFQKLAEGVDVVPLLHAVTRQPELWNENRLRTAHPGTPHTEIDDIWLRFNDLDEYTATGKVDSILDQHESVWYPAAAKLPQARPIIYDLMRRVEGERLGRVLITRLAPGKRIAPHVDGGEHAAYFDRYHVTLQNLPGSVFRAGNEQIAAKLGDVFWFDNAQEHSVVNNSVDDRLTMIVDIRTTR